MAHASDPFFRTFHALRIKGFAKAETIAEVADLPASVVEEHLVALERPHGVTADGHDGDLLKDHGWICSQTVLIPVSIPCLAMACRPH